MADLQLMVSLERINMVITIIIITVAGIAEEAISTLKDITNQIIIAAWQEDPHVVEAGTEVAVLHPIIFSSDQG